MDENGSNSWFITDETLWPSLSRFLSSVALLFSATSPSVALLFSVPSLAVALLDGDEPLSLCLS